MKLQALADPYFHGLANVDREPSTQPISKLEFEFERRKLTKDDVRELIYREVLVVHFEFFSCMSWLPVNACILFKHTDSRVPPSDAPGVSPWRRSNQLHVPKVCTMIFSLFF